MIDFGLVLSTGRTGTMFFRDYITETFESAVCLHEPKPSRRFKIYSNLLLSQKISPSWVARQYFNNRSKYLSGELHNKIYVESNNFLFGCVPALNRLHPQIKILHIIRNPIDYVESHLNHGFWKGKKRYGAKYLPFWMEKLELSGSEKNNPFIILAKRWIYVNEVISSYKSTNPYLLVRFEDLFNSDPEVADLTINEIRRFFGQNKLEQPYDLSIKKNPSRINVSIPNKELALIHQLIENLTTDNKFGDYISKAN